MPVSQEYIRGWSQALTFGADSNLETVINENCIATDIISILDERKGEWLLDNDQHGTTIPKELFDQNDDVLKAALQSKIITEVSDQENRVSFGKIALIRGSDRPELVPFDLRDQADHFLLVLIPFKVLATNEEKVATLLMDREG